MAKNKKLSSSEFSFVLKKIKHITSMDVMTNHLKKLTNDLTLQIKQVESGQQMYRVIHINSRGETVSEFSYPPIKEHCSGTL